MKGNKLWLFTEGIEKSVVEEPFPQKSMQRPEGGGGDSRGNSGVFPILLVSLAILSVGFWFSFSGETGELMLFILHKEDEYIDGLGQRKRG